MDTLTDPKQNSNLLQAIAGSVTRTTSDALYHEQLALATSLLGARHAYLTEVVDGETLRTLASWQDGQRGPSLEYCTNGTPCADVIRDGIQLIDHAIAKRFPDDEFIQEHGFESYVGCPITDAHGQTVGHLCVYSDERMEEPNTAVAVASLIAIRISSELQHWQDKRQLEEQHRIRETLLANLPGMAYLCANDRDWTMQFVSAGCTALTGYTRSELESSRPLWAELIHTDDRDSVWLSVQAALAENQKFEIQYRIVTQSGQTKWIWERGCGIANLEGTVQFIEGFVTDVTPLKDYKIALVRSEAYAKAIVSTAGDGIITIDAHGCIESFNKAAEKMFGYTTNEVVGQSVSVLMPEPHRSEHDDYIKQYLETGDAKIIGNGRELSARRKDKSTFPIYITVSEITLDTQPSFAAIIRDISEQKAAEETLQAAEQRFRAVFDQRHQLAGIVSTDGILLEANQKSLDFAGLERADVIGHYFWDTPWWSHSPELQQRLRDAIKAAAQGETVRFEATHPRPDGHMGTVDFSLRPITDEAGKVVYIVPESHDISEQRQAEEEAKLHRERLAHVSRLSTLGEMAAGIAHEINQPLTAIALFAQAGKRLFEAGKYKDVAGVFDKLSEHSLRAGAVIERMQAMARQGESAKNVMNCSALVDDVVKLAEAEARIHDIAIEVVMGEGLPTVNVDSVQIQQVALNLLRNGMEAMRSVECRNGNTIRLWTKRRDDGDIEVAIIDTGCGVSKTAAENLFTPFSTTKESGMGMGLSISRAIIIAHGGQLEFHNNESGGATFSFTLPAATQGDQDA